MSGYSLIASNRFETDTIEHDIRTEEEAIKLKRHYEKELGAEYTVKIFRHVGVDR